MALPFLQKKDQKNGSNGGEKNGRSPRERPSKHHKTNLKVGEKREASPEENPLVTLLTQMTFVLSG